MLALSFRGKNIIRRFWEGRCYASEEKALTSGKKMIVKQAETPVPRKAKVTFLSANNFMGHCAALSLKICSDLVGEVRLWDDSSSLRGVAMDLSHIPSSLRVLSFIGEGQLQASIRNSEIVVVMGGSWGLPKESSQDLFYKNADHVREMAQAVIVSSPKAMIGIAVPPVTSNVAFFGELLREQGTFCPNRVFGVLTLEEMRVRSAIASKLGLGPAAISVRLTGGGTPATLVPVISSASPGGEYLMDDVMEMTGSLRGLTENIKDAREGKGPEMSAGVAVAKFVRALAKGMYGEEKPVINAVVRTSCLHGVPYLAVPVSLGPAGIIGTAGIPKLSDPELRLLMNALPIIMEDISIGETWAHASKHTALAAQ